MSQLQAPTHSTISGFFRVMKQVCSHFPSPMLFTCTVPESLILEKLSFPGLQQVSVAQDIKISRLDLWILLGFYPLIFLGFYPLIFLGFYPLIFLGIFHSAFLSEPALAALSACATSVPTYHGMSTPTVNAGGRADTGRRA